MAVLFVFLLLFGCTTKVSTENENLDKNNLLNDTNLTPTKSDYNLPEQKNEEKNSTSLESAIKNGLVEGEFLANGNYYRK
jgi:hypothetical protein